MKKVLFFLKKYWLQIAEILAYINTRIILFLVYFLMFPFFAIPLKILKLVRKKKEITNWKEYKRVVDVKEQF